MKQIPNILTALRIMLIPAIIAVFFIEDFKFASFLAFLIFVAAGATDFFDGYLARKLKVESKLGAMLDPIADKLMVGAALILLVHFGTADLIPVIIIILRELLVSGYREFIASHNGEMPVTKLAKWKTTFQFVAITMLFFIPFAQEQYLGEVQMVARFLLWFSALLTFITGWQYTTHTIKFIGKLK